MKIGILTYFNVHNHGAVLQANALRTILNAKGQECFFLEFERDYCNLNGNQTKKYKIGPGSIPFYLQYLLEKGIGNILFNLKKKRLLDRYRACHLPSGGKCTQFDGDLVIIGSDEVFSLEIGVNPVLYGNSLSISHISSYAGSFGPTTAQEVIRQRQDTMIAKGLHRQEAVSVRDQNSWDIVKEIAGIEAALVCDPVILYGYQKEMQIYRAPIRDYILIYSYDKNMNDTQSASQILKFAKSKGWKVISVGFYHKWCKSVNATPDELLGWIKSARIVITDTFHGTVLAMICNTPMVVRVRGNQNKLSFLLWEYGLTNRAICSFEQLAEAADKPVDFAAVNNMIQEKKTTSMAFLENVLERAAE